MDKIKKIPSDPTIRNPNQNPNRNLFDFIHGRDNLTLEQRNQRSIGNIISDNYQYFTYPIAILIALCLGWYYFDNIYNGAVFIVAHTVHGLSSLAEFITHAYNSGMSTIGNSIYNGLTNIGNSISSGFSNLMGWLAGNGDASPGPGAGRDVNVIGESGRLATDSPQFTDAIPEDVLQRRFSGLMCDSPDFD